MILCVVRGYIPYCNSEAPKEDKAADDTADQKVQGKEGNAPTEGTAAGNNLEKHTVYLQRQTAQEP